MNWDWWKKLYYFNLVWELKLSWKFFLLIIPNSGCYDLLHNWSNKKNWKSESLDWKYQSQKFRLLESTVRPVYDPLGTPKLWPMLTDGGRRSGVPLYVIWTLKMGSKNGGRCRLVVVFRDGHWLRFDYIWIMIFLHQ